MTAKRAGLPFPGNGGPYIQDMNLNRMEYRGNSFISVVFLIELVIFFYLMQFFFPLMMNILSDGTANGEAVIFHYSLSLLFLFMHILIVFYITKDSREINAGKMFSYPSMFHVLTWKPPTWTIVITLTGFIGVAYYFLYRRNIFMGNNPLGIHIPGTGNYFNTK